MYARSKHSPKKFSGSKSKDVGSAGVSNSIKHRETKAAESSSYYEDKEITLPVIKMVDSEKYLQCFRTILSRPPEGGIGMEDLDKLQMELEMMLSNVVLRQRILHAEIAQISVAEETKSKKTASLSLAKLKRSRKHEDRNDSDNIDTDNADDGKDSTNTDNDERCDSMDEFKEFSGRHPPKRSIPLVPPSVVPISRNDITNKFWAMIEPYCAEITAEDIKFLEDLVKSYDAYEKEEYKKVSPLGTHYTLRWAHKDIKEENDISTWNKSENDVDEICDAKSIDSLNSSACVPGPMVQRLVSALVEENPSSSSSVTKRGRSDKETDENCGQPLMKKSKDLGLNGFISTSNDGEYSEQERNYRMLPLFHTSQCFEKKVRKELEDIGFLDPTNENNQDDSDEILSELTRCQEELNGVSTKNKKVLTHLLQVAKTEFKRQQIKNQIKVINSELADINMKNISLKLKKKHLCKKEAEDAWKLLKEREALLNKLEEIS